MEPSHTRQELPTFCAQVPQEHHRNGEASLVAVACRTPSADPCRDTLVETS